MRIEQAPAKKGSKNRLMGAGMGLVLVGALLSAGGARATHRTASIEAAKSESARFAPLTPDGVVPGEAVADRDVLDLQLD